MGTYRPMLWTWMLLMWDLCSALYPGCSLVGDGHTEFQPGLPPWPRPSESYNLFLLLGTALYPTINPIFSHPRPPLN